jgi:hypothetical protein
VTLVPSASLTHWTAGLLPQGAQVVPAVLALAGAAKAADAATADRAMRMRFMMNSYVLVGKAGMFSRDGLRNAGLF